MKNLKSIALMMLTVVFTFTSCQDEINTENGQNPNTNSNNSQTANNLKRVNSFDGGNDDFLDGISCSSIILPVVATVNGTQINIVNASNYQQVIDVLAELNNDNDTIVFQFPITVMLSNYTEVVVTNQIEFDAIADACEALEQTGDDAISCLDINFPITVLTYNVSFDQTGSLVLESKEELYTYLENQSNEELFALNYPISATLNDETDVTIASDAELQASISDCLGIEGIEDDAEEEALELEAILVDGVYQIESFVNDGVDTATVYAEYTIDFANDFTVLAENIVNATVQDVEGTYTVASNTQVNLNLEFTGNANFILLNNNWTVSNYSASTISLQSTTNAAITLVLTQI